jgi:hypothetical protein
MRTLVLTVFVMPDLRFGEVSGVAVDSKGNRA